MGSSWLFCIQWNPTIQDPAGSQLAVLYKEVSLIQRLICTQLYVFRTADSALIREVSFIWSVLYREVPLCMSVCEDIHTVHYRVRYECAPGPSADYDAPVNEFGQPTIKFLILREILPNLLPNFGKCQDHIDVLCMCIEVVQAQRSLLQL